ncbi:MAG: SpoIIE family protein phosphatase [Planctomycetota bacterium]
MSASPDSKQDQNGTIRFEVLSAPAGSLSSLLIDLAIGERPLVLGRGSSADLVLPDPSVSRRHVELRADAGSWTVTDLGSRHGTMVNGVPLAPAEPTPLNEGDQLRIGPFALRARRPGSGTVGATTIEDIGVSMSSAEAIPQTELTGLAQQRLDVLLAAAEEFGKADGTEDLWARLLDATRRATGCDRAHVLRSSPGSRDVEVVAPQPADPRESPRVSRSLVSMAARGWMAQLTGEQQVAHHAQSVIDLGIQSALCAPIFLGDSVEALLYVDARAGERSIEKDAATFCKSLASLAGLALADIKRLELERERAQLRRDLDVAREAQRRIMPPERGTIGSVRYAVIARPGRVVAGDLFDVVELDNGRTSVFLGDVSGKGVGAAMTMAMVQTHIRVALRQHVSLARVVDDVNRSLHARSSAGTFVTLWIGLIDPATRSMEYVDAGHGYWCSLAQSDVRHLSADSDGMPIGIQPDTTYEANHISFDEGERVLVFSDGVAEQRGPDGPMFGTRTLGELMRGSDGPDTDVERLLAGVASHAGRDTFDDDLTVASFELI